ncbi:MAG: MFS transporter [Betaproteobacteria bacterium]|nr:MFS transporter [Betaproteobacteria bacterium]
MIFLARYGALLARPHLRAALVASVVGRLPIGVTGLSILLLAQATSGSFVRGGAASAAYVVGLASVAPLVGRIIDRAGPVGVLFGSAFAFPAALGSLVFAVQGEASSVLMYALAFSAGASFPPITVCMRTFFRRELGEQSMLAAAYSLESVLIETIFIVGPMLVALFLAVASPSAAVFFAALCASIGTLLFVRSPALRGWRIEPRADKSLFGPLAERGFAPLLAVVLGYSAAFGLVEIGITAYATEAGHPALAGVMLGLMSAGSAAGGLAYGSRDWRLPLARQFAVVLCALGIGVALLALAANAWLFALLSVVAGVVMAPALTIQTMLVSRIASPQHATEAFTWSSTGLLIGVGIGIAAGGWLIERWGSSATFVAAAIASLGAGVLALRLRAPD